MINRLIDLCVQHRGIVLLLTLSACLLGWWAMRSMPLDAVPDLTDTQVIIYSRWDRSPDLIEDQVTYPLVTAMLGAPQVKTVRGFSDFGSSFVYVIFEDGTDIYWARSRTLEYLSGVLPRLPEGVRTELGADATGLGWVFQYALVDDTGTRSLEEVRAYQDWYLRYYLKSVPGVAEVASVGGFVRQFQVQVDPLRLQAYGLSLRQVVQAVQGGNREVGGRLLEFGGTEYMVRGRGYARTLEDFENIVLTASDDGSPIRIRDLGQVSLGPDYRRGVTDLNGEGEVVSGIVVMRQGQNALTVIDAVKEKIREIEPGLPAGVRIVPIYDRAELIRRAIDTSTRTLLEVVITVSLVIFLFLWHLPSALIPVITIPVAILISFLPFRLLGVTANIMSLGGLVIAAGAMVDAAIVVVEQVHKKLENWRREGGLGDFREVVLAGVKEVAGPSFFALLVIAVSFLPILALESVAGRMFRPLAYTKTLAMLVAAVLAVTLDPALRLWFTRTAPFSFRAAWLTRLANAAWVGPIHSEDHHPLSRRLIRLYEPVVSWSLRRKGWVLGGALALMLLTLPVYFRLGSEFLPPLEEGSLLYMPSTMPGISITEAQKVLQVTNRILRQFPEVETVLGKAGRAETATDPAPVSMLETLVVLKPPSTWRPGLTQEELIRQMNEALRIPGLANAWTMPIKGRIEMLTTGLRTPLGIKISGADLAVIEGLGAQIEALLPKVRGTRSVFAERAGTGYFLDCEWDREALARYGLSLDEAQDLVQNAIGGETVTTAVQGRERYGVNVRLQRDFRTELSDLERLPVAVGDGRRQIPLGELARLRTVSGPAMIRNENGLLTGYVYIDLAGRDPEGFVAEAAPLLRQHLRLPPGYAISWSGEYEAARRAKERLFLVLPLTLLLILLLLYLNTRSITKTMIVLLAVPFSAIGAVWLLYLLGYNLSVAVWVGLIALLGVDAETGIFMLLYLDLAYAQAKKEGRLTGRLQLREVILEGAARRLRPKFMTAATLLVGLIPVMWAGGTGAGMMKRIAAPIIGGVVTSFLLELLVYPPLYELWKWHGELKKAGGE